MKTTGQKTAVHWTPRDANREADALANGNSSGFDSAKEYKFDLAHMAWRILPHALKMGRISSRGKEKRTTPGQGQEAATQTT